MNSETSKSTKSDTTRRALSTTDFKRMKQNGDKISMVTAYDYPSAKLAEAAGVDMILVGDSLGMVVLGYDSTIPVTLADMLHHTKAVTRGAKQSFVVTDMPYLTYHGSLDKTLESAGKLMQEGLASAVKMEGGAELAPTIQTCVRAGIPVMGHLGLTPQSSLTIGGYKVQGRSIDQGRQMLKDALALQEAGVCAIVLEMVPEELAAWMTEQLDVPTIGIGAGRYTDGQVLVYHDLLQYASSLEARFYKTYANLGEQVLSGLTQYIQDVKNKAFPQEEHVFHMKEEVLHKLKKEADFK